MIIFLNGPFGIGKTTVGKLLQLRLENSILFDPEEIGFMLRNVLCELDPVTDFQDYTLWRQLIPIVAELLQKKYERSLILPMTIWRPEYFDQVLSGLQAVDSPVYVYTLIARPEILRERILSRDFAVEWSLERMDQWLHNFKRMDLGTTKDTSDMSPSVVVNTIIKNIDEPLECK
jgi:deoxyadenosine/deoxycytidine kinase